MVWSQETVNGNPREILRTGEGGMEAAGEKGREMCPPYLCVSVNCQTGTRDSKLEDENQTKYDHILKVGLN